MNLQPKTLEKLRNLINEETEYRSGPKIVAFFSQLGLHDTYGQGFPSRWIYTDQKLQQINGTPDMDKCIRLLFSPVNFIGRFADLMKFIDEFNQYLSFDGWSVVVEGRDITFRKANISNLNVDGAITTENEFLRREFSEVSLDKLKIDSSITDVLNSRLEEIKKCLVSKSPLAVIFLCGSTLEGILLAIATNNIVIFNKSSCSPKDKNGKVKPLHDWSLANYIDVAKETGFVQEDVKKFSHVLREFRNYIHPYQQHLEGFNPSDQTAILCWQVLKAAVFQIVEKVNV